MGVCVWSKIPAQHNWRAAAVGWQWYNKFCANEHLHKNLSSMADVTRSQCHGQGGVA